MRHEILSAATSLIQRYGFRKLTLEDIAKAVGKRKSFLYYYYAGKEELIEAVVRREYAAIVDAAQKIVQSHSGARERLRALIHGRLREIRERMALYRIAHSDIHSDLGDRHALFQMIRTTFDLGDSRFLERLVREGVESGEFMKLSDEGIRSVSFYVLSAQRGLELNLATGEDGWDPFEHISTPIDIFLRGLERR